MGREISAVDRTTGEWAPVQQLLSEVEPTLPKTGQPNAIAKIRNTLLKSWLDDDDWRWINKNNEQGILPYDRDGASRLRAALAEVSCDFKRINLETKGREHPEREDAYIATDMKEMFESL